MSDYKLSIVVPVYKEEKTLTRFSISPKTSEILIRRNAGFENNLPLKVTI